MRCLTKMSTAASVCSNQSNEKNSDYRVGGNGGVEISDLDNTNDFLFFITIIMQFVKLDSVRLLDCNLGVLQYSAVAFRLEIVLGASPYSIYHFLLLFPIQVSPDYHIYP